MGIKLVVVDDAPFIREVFRNIFLHSPFDLVGEAENGEQAVDIVCKLKPDLVIMDIVMPKKNGIDASLEILEKLPETKIIACTTVDHESMVMKALNSGCVSFIEKPFDSKTVMETARKAMGLVENLK